jgi:hypothetical protein
VLEELERVARPGDSITFLPEGLLANYLMRRVEPTGYLQFTPPAIAMYGEGAMLEAFRSDPPDWIALTSIDTAEYGPRFFGKEYALNLNAWIESNYEPAQTFRASWFDKLFEIRLLRRKSAVSRGMDASPMPRICRGTRDQVGLESDDAGNAACCCCWPACPSGGGRWRSSARISAT